MLVSKLEWGGTFGVTEILVLIKVLNLTILWHWSNVKCYLNIFSNGNFCSTSLKLLWETWEIDEVIGNDVTVSDNEVDDIEEDTETMSADCDDCWWLLLGRKTITVFPTVVMNSSKPNTVLVNIPNNVVLY